MDENNLNNNSLSRESGIPYTTIDGFFKKGTDNIRLSTLVKLANFFDVTLDYLVYNDEIKEEEQVNNAYLNQDEATLVNNYRMLNSDGKEELLDHSAYYTTKAKYKKRIEPINLQEQNQKQA
ncbi:MAG: helix-turn-helix transcriptional regulator [bacterium]